VRRALLAALALVAGCAAPLEDRSRFLEPGGGGGGEACPADTDVEALLAAGCAGAVCHSSEAMAAGLDLVSPGVVGRLADVPAAACADHLLVAPGEPDASLLLLKLGDDPPCGNTMPLGGARLPAEQIACVRQWIETLEDA
jgi:hypothetical protein